IIAARMRAPARFHARLRRVARTRFIAERKFSSSSAMYWRPHEVRNPEESNTHCASAIVPCRGAASVEGTGEVSAESAPESLGALGGVRSTRFGLASIINLLSRV